MQMIPNGTTVSYQYTSPATGEKVAGVGRVIDWTVIGTDRGYSIKPADGSACVNVRSIGVQAYKAATLQAFDALAADDRRADAEHRAAVRMAARKAF